MPNSQPAKPTSQRFVFADALRGIACLAVLAHHLYHGHPLQPVLERDFPAFLHGATAYGVYGVQIFFVLSGFVIAHSLRATPMNGATVGRFVLRRQLRLDPPYWCMMLICLALSLVESRIPGPHYPVPSLSDILINAVYLQRILDVPPIVGVAWTLCIEVQFYLVFIALLWLSSLANRGNARALPPGETPSQEGAATQPLISWWSIAFLWVSGVASLVSVWHMSISFLFVQFWFFFAGGVLVYWGLMVRAARPAVLSYAAVFALAILIFTLDGKKRVDADLPALWIGWFTLTAIYIVGVRGQLTTLSLSPVLQYFGAISYSLYLVHLPVAWLVLRIGAKLTGDSTLGAAVWMVLATAASIGVAHLFFQWIERPSMAFASRFKKAAPHTPPPQLVTSDT